MVEKSPDAFRTISEVSRMLDVPTHVLRFWETKFNQLRPVKKNGGRRYYRPEDIALLRAIQNLLHNERYTIEGAQQVLKAHARNGGKNGIKNGMRNGAQNGLAMNGAAGDDDTSHRIAQARQCILEAKQRLDALTNPPPDA